MPLTAVGLIPAPIVADGSEVVSTGVVSGPE